MTEKVTVGVWEEVAARWRRLDRFARYLALLAATAWMLAVLLAVMGLYMAVKCHHQFGA